MQETAFIFKNNDQNQMVGIIHSPDTFKSSVGCLIIVGGPQYRIGAHRQYVHLARHCADKGIAAMRFDYHGVGDSSGDYPEFEQVTNDIHCAIDEFIDRTPGISSVAIWGLCEGASAILLGGTDHKSVSHAILVNPWVRSESGQAKAFVKHYYLERLKNPDFWKKIFSGHLNIKYAFSGLLSNIKKAFGAKAQSPDSPLTDTPPSAFPDKMREGLKKFKGHTLLIQSENDLVAREFDDLVSSDKAWKEILKDKISRRIDIPDTDHTFSTEKWRSDAAKATSSWILSQSNSG